MVKINFMGDVMLGELLETYRRGLIATLDKKNIDPFEYVRPTLAAADLNVINLECVFSDKSILQKPFSDILIAPERYLKFLVDNGINVVSTANNHALDHGMEAFLKSASLLKSHGIAVMGYQPGCFFQRKPTTVDVKGRVIGFLGYNISNFEDAEKQSVINRIKTTISASKDTVDTLVVSIHWGEEYTNIPPPYVVSCGQELLMAGCDILHGHHSHQIQGVVQDGKKIFAPSLGNFIFDQKVRSNRITAILSVTLDGDSQSFDYVPYYLNSRYQPEPAPQYREYIEMINSLLKDSCKPGREAMYTDTISANVKNGHRRNRIRMRMKMLGHFWDYLPYRQEIIEFRNSSEKMFSVINSESSLPKNMI